MRTTLRRGIAILTAALLALACAEREGHEPGREPGAEPPAAPEPQPSAAASVSDLALEANVAIMESFPVQLKGTLGVENPTDRSISFDVGGCPVFLRVYGLTGGEAIYDQAASTTCIMILRTVTLEPGQAETFETPTVSAADILRDNLPDGKYRVTVYLALVEGGLLEVDAGEVELAVPR